MLEKSHAFSGFSVKDIDKAKQFYGETLGIQVKQDDMGLHLAIPGTNTVFVYQKSDHEPATFTILNFPVENIDDAVDQLVKKGVDFEHYDLGGGAKTDEKGILRGLAANMGPDIAWFKDPDGNILSILQDS